jgi:hypothetical protein
MMSFSIPRLVLTLNTFDDKCPFDCGYSQSNSIAHPAMQISTALEHGRGPCTAE